MAGLDRCEECGFDPAGVTPATAPETIGSFARRYKAPLSRLLPGEDDTVVRVHPSPDSWSALEYAAHVRDVLGLFDRRVAAMVAADTPELEVVDHEQAVAAGRYNTLDPTVVADELGANAERLSATLQGLGPEDWSRQGMRAGESRTVLEVAQRGVHEAHHHLLDVGRALRAARGR
jgi:hypothetical protein